MARGNHVMSITAERYIYMCVCVCVCVYSSFRHSSGRAAAASHYNSGKQFVSGTSQNLAEAGFVLVREDYWNIPGIVSLGGFLVRVPFFLFFFFQRIVTLRRLLLHLGEQLRNTTFMRGSTWRRTSLHGSSVFLLLLTNTRSEHWRWSFHGFLNLNFFTTVVALVDNLHRFQKTFRTLSFSLPMLLAPPLNQRRSITFAPDRPRFSTPARQHFVSLSCSSSDCCSRRIAILRETERQE